MLKEQHPVWARGMEDIKLALSYARRQLRKCKWQFAKIWLASIDALGFEVMDFRMRSGCDTTTQCALLDVPPSATGTRTRVARVRAEYPNQLDYSGNERSFEVHTAFSPNI